MSAIVNSIHTEKWCSNERERKRKRKINGMKRRKKIIPNTQYYAKWTLKSDVVKNYDKNKRKKLYSTLNQTKWEEKINRKRANNNSKKNWKEKERKRMIC